MGFFEDYTQKYLNTFVKIGGKPFKIEEIEKKVRNPENEQDINLWGYYERGGPVEKISPLVGVKYDFSNSVVNGNFCAWWLGKNPERQWHKGLCERNAYFHQVGERISNYIKELDRQGIGHLPNYYSFGEEFSDLAFKYFAQDKFPTYKQALSILESGEKVSCGISKEFSVGLDYSDKYSLYHKVHKIAHISLDGNKINVMYPDLKQEISDFFNRSNAAVEIL